MSTAFTVPSGEPLGRLVAINLSLELDRIGQHGEFREIEEKRHISVIARNSADIDGKRFSMHIRGGAGVYRMRMTVRRRNERRAISYGQYFRVVPPTRNTHLAIHAPDTVKIGTWLAFKVENVGTLAAGFGKPFVIDAWSGDGWVPASVDLGPWPARLLGLGPGQRGWRAFRGRIRTH